MYGYKCIVTTKKKKKKKLFFVLYVSNLISSGKMREIVQFHI